MNFKYPQLPKSRLRWKILYAFRRKLIRFFIWLVQLFDQVFLRKQRSQFQSDCELSERIRILQNKRCWLSQQGKQSHKTEDVVDTLRLSNKCSQALVLPCCWSSSTAFRSSCCSPAQLLCKINTGCPKTRERLRTDIRLSNFRTNAVQAGPDRVKWQKKSSYWCLSIPRSTFPSNLTLGWEIQSHLENGPKINRPVSRQEGKGLAAVAIHDDPVATLGAEAISSQLSAIGR
jgi:hypothetical protein